MYILPSTPGNVVHRHAKCSIISSVCGNMNNLRNLSSFVITPGVKSLCAPWFAVADDDNDEPPAFEDGFVLSPTVTALPPRNSLRNEVASSSESSPKLTRASIIATTYLILSL